MIKTMFASAILLNIAYAALTEDAQISADCNACLNKGWK